MDNANIEPELKSLLSKLTIEIEKDSKQVELLKKGIEKNEALLRAVRASLSSGNPGGGSTGYGTKAETIRESIGRILKPQFIQDEVEEEIRRANPTMEINRNRIRAALWTMADKGEIKLIRRGNNKQPAQYEKIEGMTRIRRTTEEHRQQTLTNSPTQQLTAVAFEEAVRNKSGRIEHLAQRFNTDESTIKSLLEPASKVFRSAGGWLRLRE